MSDEYTEYETTGWFTRIIQSFVGVILGIILFFASFVVLFHNEGRIDFSQVSASAIEISATAANPAAQGKLVSTTGVLTSNELLGDNLFLKPGAYISIKRRVEMFAWEESRRTEKKKNIGGSETKKTTYSYSKMWTANPENSSSFKKPQGHQNPPKAIDDFSGRVSQAKVGIYDLDIANLDLPTLPKVPLNNQTINPKNGVQLVGNYLFQGRGTIDNPQVGDLRLQYLALANNTSATVMGKLEANNRIVPYLHEQKHRLYRAFTGTKEEATVQLKQEYHLWLWVFRAVGFLMMWFGLMMASEPLSVILDFLPFLGSISRSIAGIGAFVVAFVLSSITILISMLLHNIVALLIAIAVAVVAGFAFKKLVNSKF